MRTLPFTLSKKEASSIWMGLSANPSTSTDRCMCRSQCCSAREHIANDTARWLVTMASVAAACNIENATLTPSMVQCLCYMSPSYLNQKEKQNQTILVPSNMKAMIFFDQRKALASNPMKPPSERMGMRGCADITLWLNSVVLQGHSARVKAAAKAPNEPFSHWGWAIWQINHESDNETLRSSNHKYRGYI